MEVHDPNRVEGGDQHEKKPVIKKVKDKVKKIKDKITKKHGHGHDHDDDHSEEGEGYEYDDDEEKEIDPEVHVYNDSAGARNLASSRDENIGHGKMGLGEARIPMAAEDPWVPKKSAVASDESNLLYPSPKGAAAGGGGNLMTGSTPSAGTEQDHPSFQSPTVYDTVGAWKLASSRDENIGHGKMDLGEAMPPTAVEDPWTPKKSAVSDETQFSYPSAKVYDSVGARNVGHGKMDLGAARASTAVEDPWTPMKLETNDERQFLYTSPEVTAGDRSGNFMTGSRPATGTEQKHPSYQYPSPAVYESTTARNLTCGRDENMGPGKMSLGEVMASEAVEDPGMPKKSVASDESQLFYPSPKESVGGNKVGMLGAITERVEEDPAAPRAMVEDSPVNRMEQNHPSYQSPTGRDEVGEPPLLSSFQAMSVSDEPKDRRYVTETLPPGAHNQFSPDEAHQDLAGEQKSPTYADKISSTATAAKDAAVSAAISAYEKVSGAGTALLGKGTTEEEKYDVKLGQSGQPGQPLSDKVSGVGTAIMGKGTSEVEKHDTISGQHGQPGQPMSDKGVSIKEYMAGKLRPGDEDWALSEVITESIRNDKQEAANASAGRAREGSGEGSAGKGMVDKIKGAVTSWIGAGAHPSETTDTGFKENQQSAYTGTQETQEKRMQ